MSKPIPRILSIAGSDSGGGAGIQADIKTASALGAYAMTAITAVTAQDTTGVHAVQLMSPELVRAQIVACLSDVGADAIRIGMLGSAQIVSVVAGVLRDHAASIPIVLDPVIASTSGTALLDADGVKLLRDELIPLSALVTPNLPETDILLGPGASQDPEAAGRAFLALGAGASLIKGGHGEGEALVDVLVTPEGTGHFPHARRITRQTHGTGCTLATAIAVGLAEDMTMCAAVGRAVAFVQHAMAAAPGFGRGNGPLDHAFRLRPGWVECEVAHVHWTWVQKNGSRNE
jgi:hydroxymethylpyrimidine/phosphomethylpyrimidine kinase